MSALSVPLTTLACSEVLAAMLLRCWGRACKAWAGEGMRCAFLGCKA